MSLHFRRYVISGILTIVPLWITWLLLDFVFRQLARFGGPLVRTMARNVREESPALARLLLHEWFQDLLAVVIVVLSLYLLGWLANRVVGRRIVHAFESFLGRIPLVETIYGAVRQLIGVLQTRPENVQRVVLIEFPHSDMKTVGLATRTFRDSVTGEDLAAVFVPTTPNPTNGYLEIVPLERVISTDWTFDEAMSFVVSGGAIGPDEVPFTRPA